ncbi:MAG: PTS sugar transporter subunit IIA [Planctomycetota bacterium]
MIESPFCSENPLFALSVLLGLGFLLGHLVEKLKLPNLIGQILAGILVGPFGLDLFSPETFHNFGQITDFILCIFGFTMGTHLVLRQLHNASQRIFNIVICQIVLIPLLIFVVLLYGLAMPLPQCLLLAAIGLSTSPSSIIHLVVHRRSRGVFTKTLVTSVALISIASLVLFSIVFEVAQSIVDQQESLHIATLFLAPARDILGAILVGLGIALSLLWLTRKSKSLTYHFSVLIIALLLLAGTCRALGLPDFLSSMVLGFIVSNYSKKKHILLKSFDNIEPGIFVLFFVLAGTHIDFSLVKTAGIAGAAFVLARAAGKFIAPTLGAYLSNSPQSVKRWIGIALFPQANIAVGLVLLVENQAQFAPFSDSITTIVLGAVLVCETIGSILTDLAIRQSGEVNKNRVRLLEFLQEEYILVGLQQTDKWKALAELATFMHRVHGIREISRTGLVKSVIEREEKMSTGMGEGLAVPHAMIEGGPKIRGVIGVSHKGIDYEAIDGKPAYLIVLIATPEAHYDQHLQVLAGIAKIFGQDPEIMNDILRAKAAADVHEILQRGHADAVNVYLSE